MSNFPLKPPNSSDHSSSYSSQSPNKKAKKKHKKKMRKQEERERVKKSREEMEQERKEVEENLVAHEMLSRSEEFAPEKIGMLEKYCKVHYKAKKEGVEEEELSEGETLKYEVGDKSWSALWGASPDDDALTKLHNEIIGFLRICGPTLRNINLRKKIFFFTKMFVKEVLPDCVIKVSGSTAIMTYLTRSPIDVVLFFPNKTSSEAKNAQLLVEASKKEDWIYTCTLINGKIKNSKLVVNICFNKGAAITVIPVFKKFLLFYPELKYLLVVIKAFLKTRGLHLAYRGGMSSFVLTILIISYLQQIKKENFDRDILLSEHLFSFFHLYGVKFNYDDLGISIRGAGEYFLRSSRDWVSKDKFHSTTLCVENPQDISIDVGKGVYKIYQVRNAFESAYEYMRLSGPGKDSLLKDIIGDLTTI
ncbi:unnamed protein product [Moneuplotes crassus]|uniref:PAP-associated domain-containing protein n=1 Tax=Euplotes crassus TaxID=5936 RepID=A0AAD1XFN8_EUPCR|nr:unnamed protein product [Moneuplotes crassus]